MLKVLGKAKHRHKVLVEDISGTFSQTSASESGSISHEIKLRVDALNVMRVQIAQGCWSGPDVDHADDRFSSSVYWSLISDDNSITSVPEVQ